MRLYSIKSRIPFIMILLIITIFIPPSSNHGQVWAQERNITEYHIAQDGTGDFTTIQEGVDHAHDGDVLIIYPGIYNEKVTVSDKTLYLAGTDKNSCIIQNDTTVYSSPTLSIAAGCVSNLTIIGTGSGTALPISLNEKLLLPASDLDKSLDSYGGYAIHVEQDFLFQKELRFSNCNILSRNNYCVGLGTRGGSSIVFENCELTAAGNGGCFFLHDSILNESFYGEADFIIRNCEMKCLLSPYIMTFESYKPANRLNLTFQNVKASVLAYSNDIVYNANNLNTYYTVGELARLEDAGMLYDNGRTSSVKTGLVHIYDQQESFQYMEILATILTTDNYINLMNLTLPEGILYIDSDNKDINTLQHQVIDIENYSGQSEQGWCGLKNARLTPDSTGNTLPEMNAVTQ